LAMISHMRFSVLQPACRQPGLSAIPVTPE